MTTDTETPNGRPTIPDNEIIERFGGIRPMASKLGVAVTTVQGWKERGHIPEGRFSQIAAAAATHEIDIGLNKAPAPEPAQPAEPKPAPVTVEPAPPEPKPEARAQLEPEPETEPEPEPVTEPEPEPAPPAEDVAPAAAKPDAPAAPAAGVSALTLVVVVVLLTGLILTGPLWQSELYPGTGADPMQVDNSRLDNIADSLAKLESSIGDLRRDLEGGDGTLAGRIDALEAGGGETGAAFAEQLGAIENSLRALETDLAAIESRLASIEATKGDLPDQVKTTLEATDSALGALEGEVGTLTQAVADQGQAMHDDVASVGATVTGLEARVAALESRPVQTGEKIAAMVLLLGDVESGLNSGKSYRAALDRLETLGRDDPMIAGGEAVAALSAWADQGIPNRLVLQRSFAELAPEIDREVARLKEETWLDSVWNSVKSLVTIRRIDGANLTPIGQAEQALEQGDLTGAVAAFEGTGPLGSDGDVWLNQVKARISAEAEIVSLYGQMISPLVGDGNGGGAAAQ